MALGLFEIHDLSIRKTRLPFYKTTLNQSETQFPISVFAFQQHQLCHDVE